MNKPKVFISYAHSSAEHKQAVADLVAVLRSEGLTVVVDTDVKKPQGAEEGWPRWMKHQLKEADWVLLFFDESYRRRFDGEEEIGKGIGATWEGAIITHHYYREATINKKFIPLLSDEASTDLIPDELFGYNRYYIPRQATELAAILCSAENAIALGQVPDLPTKTEPNPVITQPETKNKSSDGLRRKTKKHRKVGKPTLVAKFQEENGELCWIKQRRENLKSFYFELWIEGSPTRTESVIFEILDVGFKDNPWTVSREDASPHQVREFLTDEGASSYGDVEIKIRGKNSKGVVLWEIQSSLYKALKAFYRARIDRKDILRALKQIEDH